MSAPPIAYWWHGLSVDRPPPPEESSEEAAQRRILARLGEYTEQIVRPLNMRPTSAALLDASVERVRVRISNAGAVIVLVIAPTGDLAAEVFFLRSLAGRNVYTPQLLGHDLSCTVVPFAYTLQSYSTGMPLSCVEDPALVRLAARQLGRALRRIHQAPAPGFGAPNVAGRWPMHTWPEVVARWFEGAGHAARLGEILDGREMCALTTATIEHPDIACAAPMVLHGAVSPDAALVSLGEAITLDALVAPGEIVGGDPLFDLAFALAPGNPLPFRQGLLEGYTNSGPLDEAQRIRLRRLQLLFTAATLAASGDPAVLARLPADLAAALTTLPS